jgi:hypothetical protein
LEQFGISLQYRYISYWMLKEEAFNSINI